MPNVFILEKDAKARRSLTDSLSESFDLEFFFNGAKVKNIFHDRHYDLIILDLPSQPEPFKLLQWIKKDLPYTPVIVTSRSESTEIVVKTIKEGASDFISKPYSAERICLAVEQAMEERSLKNEIDYLRRNQDVIYDFDKVIAESDAMKGIIATLKKFAKTDATIMMTGETGTGKSFLSGSIHFNSKRARRPFVKINCANIPETLLESELFGHEKGAFTGADRLRVGRFEQADGGTLFLDEIGEISLSLQAKLLRILEDKAFERVGGNRTINVDVRVIAATNRHLEKLIEEGKFREDLYYRINILSVDLPPLRERKACIKPMANMMLQKICRSLKKKIEGFSDPVMERIISYNWPGNIRQLSNVIERAAILQEGPIIRMENIAIPVAAPQTSTETPGIHLPPLSPAQATEKELILSALEENLWIQKDAAEKLGLSPRTLNYKIKKYNITHSRWRKNK
ncbi:MAG: sigma-54-dependent Fis family transcriptional regulator [Deltaproteobacteria bacterium]|nr:MAG: sigma-54-dependent Fis family transcriptional regulator [Deltaproteobacteria bacterium]